MYNLYLISGWLFFDHDTHFYINRPSSNSRVVFETLNFTQALDIFEVLVALFFFNEELFQKICFLQFIETAYEIINLFIKSLKLL